MGRRVKRFLIIIPAAAVLLSSFLLATCSNEFDIFEAIKTEMKVANDLFLVVKSVTPVNEISEVNPSSAIVIQFDRALDGETIDPSTIFVTNVAGGADPVWEGIPNDATKTLTIVANPYLEGPSAYQVTITKGLKGSDGSYVQDEYSWKFYTKSAPGGSVFVDIDPDAKPYFNTSTVNLDININSQVTSYRYAIIDESEDSRTDALAALTMQSWIAESGPVSHIAQVIGVPTGDGYKRVYLQVTNGSDIPEPSYDRIYYDTTKPKVDILSGPPSSVDLGEASLHDLDAWSSDGGSGIDPDSGYQWQALLTSGSGSLAFTDSKALDTKVSDPSGTTDGVFTLRIRATDRAGNYKDATQSVTWDRTAPDPPVFTTGTTASPTTDTSPTWAWGTGGSADSKLYFRRSLDGSKNVYTYGTSYTPSSLAYGPHTLNIAESDDIGNWSTVVPRTIYVSPSGISPLWGATWVSRTPTLSWPTNFLKITYTVYFGVAGSRKSQIYSGLGSSVAAPYTLSYSTKYEWYYTAKSLTGTTRYPAGKDYYCFTTLPKIIILP